MEIGFTRDRDASFKGKTSCFTIRGDRAYVGNDAFQRSVISLLSR